MILGLCMADLSWPTQAGIRCREFFGAASDSRSALDSDSDTSEDLGGAGAIGDTTGMAVGRFMTITDSSLTAESSAMTGSIMVIPITATLTMVGSVTAALPTAALTTGATATRLTEVRAFTRNQVGTRAGSVALITAEMLEAFLRAGTPALEAAASMVVRMVAAGGTKDRSAAS